MIPAKIESGYPPKNYAFTGEWLEERLGKRKAKRNRTPIWYPIYQAEDGSIVCPVWLAQLTPPNPKPQVEPCSEQD